MQTNNLKNYLHLHLIVFIWGFTAILGALISIDAIPLVWYRMLLASVFILLYFLFKKKSLKIEPKIALKFMFGGLIFGVIPILLSLLGFIGAGNADVIAEINANPSVNTQMVGPMVIGHFLPKWALMAHAILCFAGLSSTLDSAFCAISSLATIDIYKRYINPKSSYETLLKVGRFSMFLLAVVGVAIALFQPKLLWVFLIYGALASAAFFPAFLSIYWKKLSAQGAMWAIILSLVLGLPLSIYANIKEDTNLIVLSAVLSVAIGLIVCLTFGFFNKKEYDFPVIKSDEL